jgi:hypothetical protein
MLFIRFCEKPPGDEDPSEISLVVSGKLELAAYKSPRVGYTFGDVRNDYPLSFDNSKRGIFKVRPTDYGVPGKYFFLQRSHPIHKVFESRKAKDYFLANIIRKEMYNLTISFN